MNPKGSASRGELTKAMSATLREVRTHHQQIAAMLAGIQQLMDGQAALAEAFEANRGNVEVVLEGLLKRVEALESIVIEMKGHPLGLRCESGTDICGIRVMIEAEQGG